jgi:4-hydroxy-2-oxoheptanedioate aldolase
LYAGNDYAVHANEVIITMAMIETREAVDNLDDILSTPGLDAVYIGPADLSQSFGLTPRMDPQEPKLIAVIDQILHQARQHNVVVGMHTGSVAYARRMAAKGMQFVTIGSDARLMANAAQATTAAFKNADGESANTGY